MSRETLERLARDLAADVPLPAADWEAIVALAERMQGFVTKLDELPLENVEPASVWGERGVSTP